MLDAWAADHDGADLWADSTVRFLDPFTKSGVFLREITSRLTTGLEAAMVERFLDRHGLSREGSHRLGSGRTRLR